MDMIDWDRVANLRAEIGAEDFAEVAEMFLDEADEVVARLRVGGPGPGLEAELHFLKGSALNLGFRELAGLCNTGEKRAANGEPVDVARVIQSYGASRAAFAAGLSASTTAA
jgi:HPt (histidine-containing phosphotransfer) domain-containing protein